MRLSLQSKILMIGNDPALAYLIGRYAEQGGYGIATVQKVPSPVEARAFHPAAIALRNLLLCVPCQGDARALLRIARRARRPG